MWIVLNTSVSRINSASNLKSRRNASGCFLEAFGLKHNGLK